MQREGVGVVLKTLIENIEREIERALFPGCLGMLSDLPFRLRGIGRECRSCRTDRTGEEEQ